MCENWGYLALAAQNRTESIEEMRHAESLAQRILFLEGLPNLQRLDKLTIGQTVPEQLRCDLDLEYQAVARLNTAISLCRDKRDSTSEQLLKTILGAEEMHIDFLETQLGLVEKLGEQLYLSKQLTMGAPAA
jgi:bacterioferritin